MWAVQQCMTFTSPPACPTSVVLLLLCVIPFFLGLAGVSPLKDPWGRLTKRLLDWFLRSSPETDSVLST